MSIAADLEKCLTRYEKGLMTISELCWLITSAANRDCCLDQTSNPPVKCPSALKSGLTERMYHGGRQRSNTR